MTCPHCGHRNPSENRFCGMCGNKLPSGNKEPERAAEPAPPPPAAPPRRSGGADAPLSGPSFLGLSSEESAPESGGYSYLFQDEPEPSHRALYIFLLLLVIGGAVAYLRWPPLRQYILNTVVPQVRQRIGIAPPPQTPPAPSAAPADQATITVSSNQPEQKPPEPAPAQPSGASEPQRPAPQAAADQPAEAKNAGATNKDDKETTAAQKSKSEAEAADEETPPPAPAARRPKPQPPAGEALVQTGEKYLYGRGVRKNCHQAVSYFRAAAEQQNPRALSRLGTMYAIGECVPLDRAVAYSWYGRALAVDRNNHLLERNMSMLWREMSPEERQRAGAR